MVVPITEEGGTEEGPTESEKEERDREQILNVALRCPKDLKVKDTQTLTAI